MSEVFELRQYTLHPGTRDTLLELFAREFVHTQEACGITIPGAFRDLGNADRFVWFRGFRDMASRKEALTCFYGGPAWKAHRDAANATMIDSDDVLLLRLVDGSAFPACMPARVNVTVYDAKSFVSGIPALTLLETEPAENNYPPLPVRSRENVIVAITENFEPEPGTFIQHLKLELTGER